MKKDCTNVPGYKTSERAARVNPMGANKGSSKAIGTNPAAARACCPDTTTKSARVTTPSEKPARKLIQNTGAPTTRAMKLKK